MYLPFSVDVKKDDLLSDSFPNNLIEKYSNEKDKYHFMLITSQTDYFKEYEDKFYKEEDGDNNGSNYGLVTKVNKELDVDMICSNVKKDKKMLMRIKEFDNLRRALTQMLHEQFRYVSYIYGGFYEISIIYIFYGSIYPSLSPHIIATSKSFSTSYSTCFFCRISTCIFKCVF